MCKSESCTFFVKEHENVNNFEVPIPVFPRGEGIVHKCLHKWDVDSLTQHPQMTNTLRIPSAKLPFSGLAA